jgi:hypothetical protein
MQGIQKLVVAAVGMVITLGSGWVLTKTGMDITGSGETLTAIVLGILTVVGVYQVENK